MGKPRDDRRLGPDRILGWLALEQRRSLRVRLRILDARERYLALRPAHLGATRSLSRRTSHEPVLPKTIPSRCDPGRSVEHGPGCSEWPAHAGTRSYGRRFAGRTSRLRLPSWHRNED